MKNQNLFPLLFLVLAFMACSTPEELVLQEGEVTGDLHKANIGKLTFMKGYVPYKEYSEDQFLKSVVLTEDLNLNIRTFLGKTLTWYLQELAPNLTVNELCAKGNYQFTFYVDGKKIYEENLNQGAGSPSYKNSMTVFSVPLASTEEEDSWGRFLWMRFMERGGGRKALRAGNHELKIEIRPYIETEELIVGKVIAEGSLMVNTVKIEVSESEMAIQSIAPASGWPLSEAPIKEEQVINLNEKILQKEFRALTSMVVIKNGELLLEEYFNGANRETLHDTRSVGKSFASTMMGIAIAEGHLKDENQTLDEFYDLKTFKNHSPKKEKVTLQSLLSMSSGFVGNDSDPESPGNEENMYPAKDWVKFTLDLPMDTEKEMEKDWVYFTAGAVVLGDIIHQKVPGGLEKYAEQKLFGPLGIKKYQWQYTPQKVANTAGGMRMSALDFAKYGQLYKNGGSWKGQQIIPKTWVEASLAPQVPREEEAKGHYGYLFWNDNYVVNGQSYEVSYCTGNGGNKIFIFKDLPLVIVITATAYGQPWAHPQIDALMENHLLPAVI